MKTNKTKLILYVAICGILFGGCSLFTQISEDTKKWGGNSGLGKSTTKAEDCVPSDFKQRLEKYKKQYKDNDEMYLKVTELLPTSRVRTFYRENEIHFNKKDGSVWSNECSTYMLRAYNEIIKENGVPTSYNKEVELVKKVNNRARKLFKEENPNETFDYR